MGTTTFSGPIKAGVIKETTGTNLGTDVKNTGQVAMTQSIMMDMAVAAGTNTYDVGVIPNDSQIVEVLMRFAIASNAGGTATMSVGKTDSGGATATAGQATVTITYIQANNLQDKAANI